MQGSYPDFPGIRISCDIPQERNLKSYCATGLPYTLTLDILIGNNLTWTAAAILQAILIRLEHWARLPSDQGYWGVTYP